MKRITITCRDDIAITIGQLLFGEAIDFSVESVTPDVPVKSHRFAISPSNKGLVAILRAAKGGEEFTTAAVEDMNRTMNLAPTSASAALSHAARAGLVAKLGKGRFTLTDKGRKAVATLEAD